MAEKINWEEVKPFLKKLPQPYAERFAVIIKTLEKEPVASFEHLLFVELVMAHLEIADLRAETKEELQEVRGFLNDRVGRFPAQ